MRSAFSAAKQALNKATLLAHPVAGATLALAVDASNTHVGACLQQRRPLHNGWEPLGFFSKKLEKAQMAYSAFDRELLACISGIKHFRFMLEGRPFRIYTDHKPLTFALSRTSEPWTARQCRHLAYIAEFSSDIRHIKGTDNLVADALSRPSPSLPGPGSAAVKPASVKAPSGSLAATAAAGPAPSNDERFLPVDFAAMAASQLTCPDTQRTASSPTLKVEKYPIQGTTLLCDVSSGTVRPLVPQSDRRQIFAAINNLSHPGIQATRRLLSSRFVWRGMAADVNRWYRECQACSRGKVSSQKKSSPTPIAVPARRFSHVHVDLVGPLPPSATGHSYLFTMIDRHTRWIEAVPIPNMEASTCADAFIAGWVSRFGVPATVTSDRGRQFTSAIWEVLCRWLGIHHVTTTAYHPQSNGMIERAHRQFKDALRSRAAGDKWTTHLPWILLGLRAAPKDDSNTSSAELVFGCWITVPGQFLDSPSRRRRRPWKNSEMYSQSPLASNLMQRWRQNLCTYVRAEVYRPFRCHTRAPSQ
jgi:hypothetical protein